MALPMLRELRIKNFAIIDELTIRFRPGLNVITGETGAGKSILIQALSLLCGTRASPDVIRTDADSAAIEALFEVGGPIDLEELGFESADEVLVRRVISLGGKGRVHINGAPATVALLSQLADSLIHVYGQHEQTLLLRAGTHLDLLDRFAALLPLRERVGCSFEELQAARRRLEDLRRARATLEERRQLLEFQAQELATSRVEPGEETSLRAEREIARHAERLRNLCAGAESTLYAGDDAMVDGLARLETGLRELLSIDPALGAPLELMETARVQLEEAAAALREHAEKVRFEPARLEEIEDRLMELGRLSRKYRVPSDELPAVLVGLQAELRGLDTVSADCAAAEARVLERGQAALTLARELSVRRADAARRLEVEMRGELAALGMDGATFEVVQNTPAEDDALRVLGPLGLDEVEFQLAANAGEGARPLTRVASGGELSRIMLALKALTAGIVDAPVLIFDEVDAGIGGAVADAVARRLKLLASTRQVLCITHLPQIAAYADHHFAVEKKRVGGRTIARARALTPDERVAELSRMLGGGIAPSEAETYARRLIHEAQARLIEGDEHSPRHQPNPTDT